MQATLKFDIEGWKYRQQIQSTFHATCTLSQIVVAHTPNANMADLSVGAGLVARKRG